MSSQAPTTPTPQAFDGQTLRWLAGAVGVILLWFAIYGHLVPFSEWAVSLFPLAPDSRAYEAVKFFVYDTPKVLMLLTLVVFAMGVVRSFFSPERTRALLAGKREGVGNVAAAGLGIVTPFCSCSAVPLFIGFVSAGVPLGVTFSFLIAAPMVNEVALGLLFALLGWKVALTYLGFGLGVAIVAGWVIGRLHLEGWLEEWVRNVRAGAVDLPAESTTLVERIKAGIEAVKDIVGKVWLWIIAGIAAGAFIHGYVPDGSAGLHHGPRRLVVGAGRRFDRHPDVFQRRRHHPRRRSAARQGRGARHVLAFMMSVIALSLPEMIILRKVLSAQTHRRLRRRRGARHPRGRLSVQCPISLNERRLSCVTSKCSVPAANVASDRRRHGQG